MIDSVMFGLTPIVVDLDQDGKSDVIAVGYHQLYGRASSFIFAIDFYGRVMPGFPIAMNRPISLNVADMDGDGEYDIMSFSAAEGVIHCFDDAGAEKPGWPIPLPEDVIGNTVAGGGAAVGDFDLDGSSEYLVQGLYHIYVFQSGGAPQPGFPATIPDSSYTYSNNWRWPPTLGDVDGDGFIEIITGADNVDPGVPGGDCFIMVYEHNGIMKENWPVYYYNRVLGHAPIPCDLNNDGILEIGFQAGDSLYFLDSNGTILPGWPVYLTSPNGFGRGSTADLTIVDINGDRNCEIFTDYSVLYADSVGHDSIAYFGFSLFFAIDNSGQPLLGYPITVNGFYPGRPPNFAYDSLSQQLYMGLFTELLTPPGGIGGDSGYIEIYIFPDSTGPPDQWPMLSHDNLMTRNYNFVDRVTSIKDEGREILPKSPILKQNYPNPFNFSTTIEFTLPKREHVTLSVYDILGREVVDIYDEVMQAGKHRRRLSLDVPSGVYFYTLKTEKTRITRKMMLVK
jgi:hypothetical protein